MDRTEAKSGERLPGELLSGDPSAVGDAAAAGEGSDDTRKAILDAVVRCFTAQGWAGTNMSLVARETGMTRGKIQYYFPVLEELKFAAIEHLYESWRRSYFDRISPDAPTRVSFDRGVEVLWELARDPLHVAMANVEAAARTDEGLRRRLAELHIEDEEQLDRATRQTFPALAAVGGHELHLGRYFTTIFIDGLASHNFPADAPIWRARLVAMLKECLSDFWVRRGVVDLDGERPGIASETPATEQGGSVPPPPNRDRTQETLALLRQAMEILSGDPAPSPDPAITG